MDWGVSMWLNKLRNYKKITPEEYQRYEAVKSMETINGRRFGKINHYNQYPEAVKHYLSLFPNNHICLHDMKIKSDLHLINEEFYSLIHNAETKEQDILRFINHDPQAYHIVGSIFNAISFRFTKQGFGHHEAYLFPEFWLGDDYRADYLLAGKGSGGFEFIFVEFEKPNGRVTLKDGHLGQVIRSGENQIGDWKCWLDANFYKLKDFFDLEKQEGAVLPKEFYNYDSSRFHYVVVGGTREDYTAETYRIRRTKEHERVIMLHYDNLYDASEELLERNTF